jgi:hypothetical protein
MELPLATWRVFTHNLPVAGGAYLRILPYALMKYGVRSVNKKEGMPAVLYLHPWEVDPGQPRLPAPWKSRMRQYIGLHGMESRLERLAKQYKLGTIYDSVYLPATARDFLQATSADSAVELARSKARIARKVSAGELT